MLETPTLSDFLGYASIGTFMCAQIPQVVKNIRLQSCDGLSLPFIANWFLGDISNLVGCILTHQLPFQTFLAAYSVVIDCVLLSQYVYYSRTSKSSLSVRGRYIRSATSPAAIRRMSIDRGASRYRKLSAVASNVAAAAAVAAQQDEHTDLRRSSTHYSRPTGRRRGHESSSSLASRGMAEDDEGVDPPSAMFDSFHSEGGRDSVPKRVSWSIERHRGRASSVGRIPPTLDIFSNESRTPTANSDAPRQDSNQLINAIESQNVVNTRSSRASRKGSTMVFLGVWALFGFGTLATRQHGMPLTSLKNTGRVLSTTPFERLVPVASTNHEVYPRDRSNEDFSESVFGIELDSDVFFDEPHNHHHPEDPPTEQVVLGRFFAWLCTTLYLTSRLPQIWKNYARKSVEGLSMYLFVFAFLGNCFYASSVLASPRRRLPPPESTKYIRESIPYLLGSIGTLTFDITIVGQSFCYRPRHRRHSTVPHTRVADANEEESGLLSDDALSTDPPGDSAIQNRGRTSCTRTA